jgi:hypothetical protein
MILRQLKGRGMVSGLFEKKRDAIPPHPAPPQALIIGQKIGSLVALFIIGVLVTIVGAE